MSNLTLCRVCLASDIKMRNIVNTRYQEIFEKHSTKLCTDGRPQTVCYMCFSQLQRFSQFMDTARKSEEILTQLSCSGIEINKETINILHRKFVRKLIQTPLQHISVNTIEKVIKKENELLTNIKVESMNNQSFIEKTKDIETSELVEGPNDCDTAIVKKEFDIDTDINEFEDKSQASHYKEAENVFKVTETRDYTETMKTEVKEEVEYDSSDAEAQQEDPEENDYQEISITNLQKKHACPHCNKSYGQKCHLNRHMKTHRSSELYSSREYTCEICGMGFVQKSTLKKHYFIHTKDKPYACKICPARCTQKIDLNRHMMKHTGQKPFTCDICQQTFSRKCNMKLHILTHSESKPFVCHVCDLSFSRRYDLNRHMKRKHTGEKPYACDKCDFRSVNASYVKTHMENKHWKERVLKTFECDKCDFTCGTANYLKIHVQKKH